MAVARGTTGLEGGRWGYIVRDRRTVERFLDRYDFLVPLLDEARVNIARVFGPETPAGLELVTDPEEGDSALFVRVETSLPPRSALDRLNVLFDDWWLDAMPAARGLVHVDVA